MDSLNLQLLGSNRGHYVPAFFKLTVNIDDDLVNINELNEEDFSVFFHEYIHYLQDISTIYGLMNCITIVDRIKYLNYTISKEEGKQFDIPVICNPDHYISTNKNLFLFYLGHATSIEKVSIESIKEVTESIILSELGEKSITKFILNIIDGKQNHLEYQFGAICIWETMAHIAQKSILPATEHNDAPYKIAELVAQYIYQPIGNKPLYVFSLCDACLMTHNPARTYVEILNRMKAHRFVPKSEAEIYDWVYSSIQLDGMTVQNKYSEIVGIAISQLQDYFTPSELENEKKWIETVLKNAEKIRLEHPTFLVDIIKSGKRDKTLFNKTTEQLGTPLIFNRQGIAYFKPPIEMLGIDIRIEQFAAIREIFSLLETGKKHCDLIIFCSNAGDKDLTDNNCSFSPWKRATEGEMCAYGFLWKTWGLSDYTPKIAPE